MKVRKLHLPCSLVAAALLGGCAVPEQANDSRHTPKVYDAAAFHETVTYTGSSFSADESKLLITSDKTGVFNVYSLDLGNSEAAALTDSATESLRAISYFPGDDRFLYTADRGGNELFHIFAQSPGSETIDLTPGDNTRATFAGWSGDKESFYVHTNERDPRLLDTFRYRADDYERQQIFENDGSYLPGRVSKDGRWLSLNRAISNSRSDVLVQNLESGEITQVTPDVDVEHGAGTFTPDSKQLYYRTNEGREFFAVWSYDLETGERAPVLEADWDVFTMSFSESGRYRISAVNEDASTRVDILDTESGSSFEIPGLPPGDLTGITFSPSETKLAFYLNSDTSPPNLYLYDIGAEQAQRLTNSLNPAIDERDLVASEVIRYPSFDDLEIPAILMRPHTASAETPVPALVWVHGGPGGQSRRNYIATLQHLVNHGYAVLAVNNRGSSGYGKTFFHLDDKNHGDEDLKDCIWGRRWLEQQDWIDGDRIGIIGGSYGGYMVAAALAFEPEAFDVGVDIFGVTNWIRTLESIPPWWTAQRNGLYGEMGDPATERERLHKISPLFHAQNIVRPLLVIQGANDPRVLQVESDELVEAVRSNGVPVDYVLFPDEGHGFSKKANRITASEKYVEFLDRYLSAPESAATPGG